jgi:hypothetical protein
MTAPSGRRLLGSGSSKRVSLQPGWQGNHFGYTLSAIPCCEEAQGTARVGSGGGRHGATDDHSQDPGRLAGAAPPCGLPGKLRRLLLGRRPAAPGRVAGRRPEHRLRGGGPAPPGRQGRAVCLPFPGQPRAAGDELCGTGPPHRPLRPSPPGPGHRPRGTTVRPLRAHSGAVRSGVGQPQGGGGACFRPSVRSPSPPGSVWGKGRR